MCDRDRRPALCSLVKGLLHDLLRVGVERGGCLSNTINNSFNPFKPAHPPRQGEEPWGCGEEHER